MEEENRACLPSGMFSEYSDFVLPQLTPSLFTIKALCYLFGQASQGKVTESHFIYNSSQPGC